jgi:hypothetical protein
MSTGVDMGEALLFLSPKKMRVAVFSEETIGIIFDDENADADLAPGLKLAVELTPLEALALADILLRKTSEVIGKQSEH